jgi:hypothetical protein
VAKPNPFAKGARGKCPTCGMDMKNCKCDMPKGKGKPMPFPPKGAKKKK